MPVTKILNLDGNYINLDSSTVEGNWEINKLALTNYDK